MKKLKAYRQEEDKERYIHLRVWTNNPRDGESACGLFWIKDSLRSMRPRYTIVRDDVTCPTCLSETVVL